MQSMESIRDRIALLEARVKVLENDLEVKDELLNQLNMTDSEAATKPAKRLEGGTKSAEKRRLNDEANDSEPNAKKDVFVPIGTLVENDEERDEDEDKDKVFEETGMRTTALGVTEIKSLCMKCEETGVTKMMLTKIPFFQEVILMSFDCSHCGHRDVQVKPGNAVQEKGVRYTFQIKTMQDLSRQIVKSDSASLRLEQLDFEIPPSRGVITNLEGLISEAMETLGETQERRMLLDGPEACAKVDEFIGKLRSVLSLDLLPLTMTIDDPSGNSYVSNPFAPRPDPQLKMVTYIRNKEQQEFLGLQNDNVDAPHAKTGARLAKQSILDQVAQHFADQEVMQIPSPCPNCKVEGTADTCIINMPFFKEMIIMAFSCENCGFRDTEVKGGGEISKQGRKETLRVLDPKVDLSRDVIKSDTAGVSIPELELELTRGSLGGLYTTVEGLVQKMFDNLFENSVFQGDAADMETKQRFDKLEADLKDCISGRREFTLVLQDPLANSYIYSPYDPPTSDPRLVTEVYDRSWDEDEELGLHDMNVDQVEFAAVDNSNTAEEMFRHLQVGEKDTHPNVFSEGGEQ